METPVPTTPPHQSSTFPLIDSATPSFATSLSFTCSTPLSSDPLCENCVALRSDKKTLQTKITRLERKLQEKETQMEINQTNWADAVKSMADRSASVSTGK